MVIVAEPEPEVASPSSKVTGIISVPPSVPPESVMVKGALAVVPLRVVAVSGMLPLNAPLPAIAPVSVAVPVAVMAVADMATVAFTVSVALLVAACAAAQISNVVRILYICILLSGAPDRRPRESCEPRPFDAGICPRLHIVNVIVKDEKGSAADLSADRALYAKSHHPFELAVTDVSMFD